MYYECTAVLSADRMSVRIEPTMFPDCSATVPHSEQSDQSAEQEHILAIGHQVLIHAIRRLASTGQQIPLPLPGEFEGGLAPLGTVTVNCVLDFADYLRILMFNAYNAMTHDQLNKLAMTHEVNLLDLHMRVMDYSDLGVPADVGDVLDVLRILGLEPLMTLGLLDPRPPKTPTP